MQDNELTFDDLYLLQGILMGGQNSKYNYHKSIYWFELLKNILKKIGYNEIKEFSGDEHPLGNIKDGSVTAGKKEFGTNLSLNIMAIK